MRDFAPLDLIRAHQWSSAFFTTFSLSLAFFEAVILDALVRQNVRQTTILADIVGIRAALSEHGARYAGRSYQVEPVAVERGCFHPKLTALVSHDEGHLMIGSGNLTIGGWGMNLECIEHLHPGFAADAFDDAASFLEDLAITDTARHGAIDSCVQLANDLRRLSAGKPRTGNIRLVSGLVRPIFDQIAAFADELGGARRVAVTSPFFDGGAAIDKLCASLGLDHVFVHAHWTDPVSGTTGANWPEHTKSRVEAVTIGPFVTQDRHLHAKVFEIICRSGRIVMSGSANATSAALSHGRNVELSVVRIQRETSIGWTLTPATRPHSGTTAGEDAAAENDIGILRAVLRGDDLNGQVLTRFPAGDATVFHLTGAGPKELATTSVSSDGGFTIKTSSLELEGWAAQRLVLRIRSKVAEDKAAEGFVTFPDIAEITRRAGAIAAPLLSMLAGTETPTDVAAVMEWFYEHPDALRQPRHGGGHGDVAPAAAEAFADVSDLIAPIVLPQAGDQHGSSDGATGWRRFLQQILASFRLPRGRIGLAVDATDDVVEGGDAQPEPQQDLPQIKDAMAAFDQLFDLLLGEDGGRRDLGVALQIGQYVFDRLEPDAIVVDGYLRKLVGALASEPLPVADRMAMAAAILLATVSRQDGAVSPGALRNARRKLLRLGIDVAEDAPDMAPVHGFARILAPDMDADALWASVRAVRTFQEEIGRYQQASPGSLQPDDFPALASLPEWSEIAAASAATRARIHFLDRYVEACPTHHYMLPTSEISRLKEKGVARAANCCGRILMCKEV